MRRHFSWSFLFSFVILTIAGLAWACTPTAYIDVTPNRATAPGPNGDPIRTTVNGSQWNNNASIEIRWNDINGPLLATATGPAFSVNIAIPTTQPGYYTIVAVTPTATNSTGVSASTLTTKAAASFEVMAPAGRAGGGENVAPSGVRSGDASSAGEGASTDGAQGGTVAIPGEQASGGTSAGGRAATAPAQAEAMAAATAPHASSVQSSGAPAAGQVAAGSAPGLSARTIADDLWSGFARQRAEIGEASLPPGQSQTGVAVGLGLAIGGGIAAAGTVAVLAAGRRGKSVSQGTLS